MSEKNDAIASAIKKAGKEAFPSLCQAIECFIQKMGGREALDCMHPEVVNESGTVYPLGIWLDIAQYDDYLDQQLEDIHRKNGREGEIEERLYFCTETTVYEVKQPADGWNNVSPKLKLHNLGCCPNCGEFSGAHMTTACDHTICLSCGEII